MNDLGLYIHVPFCGKKCSYCDFYSVGYSRSAEQLYTEAVIRNIRHYSDKTIPLDTVYFGGGTPSLLSVGHISDIISEIGKNFDLTKEAEITLEANPNTVTPEKLRELRNIGVNRLSIGVQSMNDTELSFLGRTHNAERAKKAVLDARDAGFSNISCDIMIALPGQTLQSLERSVELLTALPINHISAYILKIESGTPFDCGEIRSVMPDEDTTSELYLELIEMLRKRGFFQYEISNFSFPGYESRHNCRYWKCLDYIGIGPNAHSCYNGRRFAAAPDIQAFIDSPVQPVTITDDSPCGFEEYTMLRLRLTEGLDLDSVAEHREQIEKKIPPLLKAGYVKYNGSSVSLTEKGFLMSNSVIGFLIF